jgi:hypothetical protein
MNVRNILISAALMIPLASCANEETAAVETPTVETPTVETPAVETPAVEKPYISATQSAKMTAVVDSINHETREVTLRSADGTTKTLTVGEEARNLAQVSAGDLLTVEILRNLTVEVMADDGSELGSGALMATDRTAKGEMPGVAAVDAVITVARVEDINIEANTFKLKFKDDSVEEFVARDPENLKKSEVGDLVVITETEAIAITVEKAKAE